MIAGSYANPFKSLLTKRRPVLAGRSLLGGPAGDESIVPEAKNDRESFRLRTFMAKCQSIKLDKDRRVTLA